MKITREKEINFHPSLPRYLSSAAATSHPRSSGSVVHSTGGRAPSETRFSAESVRVGAVVVLSPQCAAPERATRRSSSPCRHRPTSLCGVEEKDEEVEQSVLSSPSPDLVKVGATNWWNLPQLPALAHKDKD
ncbi:hypothetical protein VPH35_117487 [Triticum aestivum]